MTENSTIKDPSKMIRDAGDDLAGRIETLSKRVADAAALATDKFLAAEDAAIHLAQDLEPHAKRVARATEDFAREARKSVDRALSGQKKRWYWPFD